MQVFGDSSLVDFYNLYPERDTLILIGKFLGHFCWSIKNHESTFLKTASWARPFYWKTHPDQLLHIIYGFTKISGWVFHDLPIRVKVHTWYRTVFWRNFALSCENLSLEVLKQNIGPFYNDIDDTISCWLNAVHKSLILVTKARKIVDNIFGVQNASSISPLAVMKAK